MKTSWAARVGRQLDIKKNGIDQRAGCQHSILRYTICEKWKNQSEEGNVAKSDDMKHSIELQAVESDHKQTLKQRHYPTKQAYHCI